MNKGGRDILNVINDKLLDSLAQFMFDNKKDLAFLRGSKIIVSVKNDALEFSFKEQE